MLYFLTIISCDIASTAKLNCLIERICSSLYAAIDLSFQISFYIDRVLQISYSDSNFQGCTLQISSEQFSKDMHNRSGYQLGLK